MAASKSSFRMAAPSKYFYWEDDPGRRLRPDQVTSDVALEQAKAFARAEQDKLDAANINKELG